MEKIILEKLKKCFNTNKISVLLKTKTGIENDNYIVLVDDKKYVFRIYNNKHSIRGKRTINSIEMELQFMKFVKKYDIPVLKLIECFDGKLVHEIQVDRVGRLFIISKYIEGKIVKKYTKNSSRAVGVIVNNLLNASCNFQTGKEIALNNTIFNRTKIIFDKLMSENKDNIVAYVKDTYNELMLERQEVINKNLVRGIIHGDIKLDNILFDESESSVLVLLDFDDYRYTFLIEEIMSALMHDLHSLNKNIIRSGNYKQFMQEINIDPIGSDMKHLKHFLKTRLVYNLCNYILEDKIELVNEVLRDKNINRWVL
jgi:Ser/Thr protein kinase RdoA (MazF antagonist)